MIGGYSLVARVLNERINWPDGRTVTRQHVEGWVRRQTRNALGDAPPAAVRTVKQPKRTTAKQEWDTADWVDWVLAGVPSSGAKWVFPELIPGRGAARLLQAPRL
jgi:hypothetical protein